MTDDAGPALGFPGLSPGQLCLCAARWLEACHNGKAPKVIEDAQRALEIVPLETGSMLPISIELVPDCLNAARSAVGSGRAGSV